MGRGTLLAGRDNRLRSSKAQYKPGAGYSDVEAAGTGESDAQEGIREREGQNSQRCLPPRSDTVASNGTISQGVLRERGSFNDSAGSQRCCTFLMLGLTLSFAWAEPGDPVKGKSIYERLCIASRGTQGKSDGPAGPIMTPHPADFTSPKSKGKPESGLLQTIQDGGSGTSMAGLKGQLSEQEVLDVLWYERPFGKLTASTTFG